MASLSGLSKSGASVKISRDLKNINEEPVEGVYCELATDADIFEWRIWFEGPGDSPYQGGVFEASMNFPQDYPMAPPTLRVLSEFWHPNVYRDGKVCISILHPPGNDPLSGELPEERWMPSQTVGTIMLSFQSMLSDPNISSPANLDASLQWRDHRQDFLERTKALVEKANRRVPPHVKIPHPDTDPEEKNKRLDKMKVLNELNTFSLHEGGGSSDEGSEDDSGSDEGSEEDSGEDSAECPLCKTAMTKNKTALKCPSCPTMRSKKKFLCGRKCYVFDCGEILPTGVCDREITAAEGWKCVLKIHKDDPNAEENFLATL